MSNVISIVVQSNQAIGKGEVLKTIEEALRAKYPELLIEVPSSYNDTAAVLLTSRIVLSEGISTPGLGLAVEAVDTVHQSPGGVIRLDEHNPEAISQALSVFQHRHSGQSNTQIVLVDPRTSNPDWFLKLAYVDGLYNIDMPNDSFVTSNYDMAVQIYLQYASIEKVAVEHWDWLSLLAQPGTYFSWSNNAVLPFSIQLHEQNGFVRAFVNQGLDRVNTQFSNNFASLKVDEVAEFIGIHFDPPQ